MRTLLILVLVLGFIVALTIAALLSDRPLAILETTLSEHDLARVDRVLQHNDRPTIVLTARDLNLLANHLLQRVADGTAKLALSTDRIRAQISIRLPVSPLPKYLNIDGNIAAESGRAVLTGVRVGRVTIPDSLAYQALGLVARQVDPRGGLSPLMQGYDSITILPDQVRVNIAREPGPATTIDKTRSHAADQAALRFYLDHLSALRSRGIGTTGNLTDLLQAMFTAAQRRSQVHDPVSENIALLTVLGTWAGRRDVGLLVPGEQADLSAFVLRALGEIDTAQHFLTSAALAARGDSFVSNAIGLYKEISDGDYGSGFSFSDIVSNRAGARFAERATRSPASARELQDRVADGVEDRDLIPSRLGLPPPMNGAEFARDYGHIGSPAYQAVMADIEQRLDSIPLYRD